MCSEPGPGVAEVEVFILSKHFHPIHLNGQTVFCWCPVRTVGAWTILDPKGINSSKKRGVSWSADGSPPASFHGLFRLTLPPHSFSHSLPPRFGPFQTSSPPPHERYAARATARTWVPCPGRTARVDSGWRAMAWRRVDGGGGEIGSICQSPGWVLFKPF